MNSKQQESDDFLNDLLRKSQATGVQTATVDHKTPFPNRMENTNEFVKYTQSDVSDIIGGEGAFLEEYFSGNGQDLKRGFGTDNLLFQGGGIQGATGGLNGRENNEEGVNNSETIGSFLGSSVDSDFLSPAGSYYQHQRLNSLESQSYSHQINNNLRSPSTSARTGAQFSGSLRAQTIPTIAARHSSLSSSVLSTPVDNVGGAGPTSVGATNGVMGNTAGMTQEEKMRRRREFHNAVERRRRELIKSKIKVLGKLVPPSLLNYNEEGKEMRLNKGIILHKTVEYVEYLKQVLEVQERKKIQLQNKVISLEQRRCELQKQAILPQESEHSDFGDTSSPEQIIDSRVVPQATREFNSALLQTTRDVSNTALQAAKEPPVIVDDGLLPLPDDLHQFLSGSQMEREDNTRLMFNAGSENPTGSLLHFET
ncbi:HDL261Wp [Eremothecium sinecaudum]|uniref:HDL261Wp n=1 Tax=Eremothecium sinecaudum TaxID=45286 RepID=A0A0X8HSA7_9SACH|nr:HDL261Wp [Eremothecium sinecaudum]AMD20483.1 HDL261Wp [Eremothecium sinecaudum]